jgi:uncharacterized protein
MDDRLAWRLIQAALGLMLGAVLVGCLLAGGVFNLLLFVGRSVPFLAGMREVTFEEVLTRLVLVLVVLGFYPAIRWAGVPGLRAVGFDVERPWLRSLVVGWLWGVLSIGFLFVVAVFSGALIWQPDAYGRVAGRVTAYFVGGLAVGLIEEVFVRGAMFGALRRFTHWGIAAFAVSFFFALLHFVSPQSPTGIVHGDWLSGLSLLPHLIYRTSDLTHYVPFGLTVFLMSLFLCALYQRQGHIHALIGLHAGWVFFLRGGRYVFERNTEVAPVFWGASDNVARSWAAFVLMLVLCVVVFVLPKPKRKDADAGI